VSSLDPLVRRLTSGSLEESMRKSSWLFLTASSPERASYGPLLFLLGIVLTFVVTFLLVRRFYHGRVRLADPWDCGFDGLNARMQDTAEGFGQPIKQIFEPFFRIERTVPTPFDARPTYTSRIDDRLWYWLYVPVIRITEAVSSLVGRLQQGRIHVYLIYSFATLLVLLLLIQ
jgi:hypothetical protein